MSVVSGAGAAAGAVSQSILRDRRQHAQLRVCAQLARGTSTFLSLGEGATYSSVVRAFAHGAMDCRIDPSWWTH